MSQSGDSGEPSRSESQDLPRVEPPTAGFIIQLFLIPAAIVAVVVLVYVLFGQIAASPRSPSEYLKDLRGANEERRWLAARELALILPNDKNWQNDQNFAIQLAQELDERIALRQSDDKEAQYEKYLAMALGEFSSTAIIPTLRRTVRSEVPDEVRWAAILSLGRLADRMGGLTDPAALDDLAAASQVEDPHTRKLVAFVLGSVNQPNAVPLLERLLNDPHRDVRYNAATSLARLGSLAGAQVLEEMLDGDRLRQLALPEDQLEVVPVAALESIGRLHDRNPAADVSEFEPAVRAVASQGPPMARTAAKKLLIELSRQ